MVKKCYNFRHNIIVNGGGTMLKNNLKTERKKLGYSQKQLAQILNVSQQTVGSWEVGRTEPDAKTLTKLANVFGVSVDYLTGYSPSSKAVSQEHLTNVNNRIKEELGENVKVMFHDINSFDDDEMEQLKFAIEMIKNGKRKKTP